LDCLCGKNNYSTWICVCVSCFYHFNTFVKPFFGVKTVGTLRSNEHSFLPDNTSKIESIIINIFIDLDRLGYIWINKGFLVYIKLAERVFHLKLLICLIFLMYSVVWWMIKRVGEGGGREITIINYQNNLKNPKK